MFLIAPRLNLPLCGPQGVRAVIAESFEKLHKNQLVGMGIMPLQFLPGENADSLELSGKERFTIIQPDSLSPRQQLTVKVGNTRSGLRSGFTVHLSLLSRWNKTDIDVFVEVLNY